MVFHPTQLEGLILIEPKVFGDSRGYFMETWSRRDFEAAGLNYDFVQDNQSASARRGTLRGIHYQRGAGAQAKLVRCLRGAVLDVAVDLRRESPGFLKHQSFVLSEENKKMLLIPRGFGHAFLTLSDDVVFAYKADNFYLPESEGGIRWNDPMLSIDWGFSEPILSEKDKNAPFLKDVLETL